MSMPGTSHFVEQSGARKRSRSIAGGSKHDPKKRPKLSNEQGASGLRLSMHGNVYQLKMLTLFLKRGVDQGYDFALATEMDAAGKFDDVVFGYANKNSKDDENNGNIFCDLQVNQEQDDGKNDLLCDLNEFRFLQVKHKQDDSKKITLNDLLTRKDDEFSLQKYFISYCQIKQNPKFEGFKLKDFVICTNINLDLKLINSFEEIKDEDNILHFESCSKQFQRLKLILDKFPEKDRLLLVLRSTSELYRLAKLLASCVFEGKCLELRDLFKAYHGALGEKVIECVENDKGVRVGKFRSEFIHGEKSVELERFRKAFYDEYLHVLKKHLNENEFWGKMKEMELKISSTFGKRFELNLNPELSDPQLLADRIAKKITKAEKIVEIRRESWKKVGVIKDNIHKLGGYVFVKKVNESKDIFYFSSEFLQGNIELPNDIQIFRNELIEKLERKGIIFGKSEYKFHIAKFAHVTCEDGQLYMKSSLPDDDVDEKDIEDFFNDLVFAVNQPDEIELGGIIEQEIGEYFNLIESEFMASQLQKDMLDWMKKKKGHFLTNKDGKEFLKEIKLKVSKLVLIGPTLLYLAKIEKFKISFQEDLPILDNFLNSNDKQIFNLESSHETIFGSIKVFQILKKLNAYHKEDSYIFMRLHSLLCIQDRVMEVFNSSTANLLVIECKAKEKYEGLFTLYEKLSETLKSEKKKKLILITLENDALAKKFEKDFFSNSDKDNLFEKFEDENNNLTDLTEESRDKILMEGKVLFQGKEVSVGSVVDESVHLLSGEVLSMLINNDKIEIGKAPVDSFYNDVKDYFIDRTFIRCIMIEADFMNEKSFFVIDDKNQDGSVESCDESHTDIVSISDTCDKFMKLCEEYAEHSVHWLTEKNDRFIWRQSSGDLTKLRRFVDTCEQSITEYKPNKITDISDRVVLLAAEPGMGKSVILSHLSFKTQSNPSPLWIVRSNLADHCTEFTNWNKSTTEINTLDAVKFLYKISGLQPQLFKDSKQDGEAKDKVRFALTGQNIKVVFESNVVKNIKGSSLLEIRLFAHFFNLGKMILLFDGFDESIPDYEYQVMKLLMILKDTKVKNIWLTTRPYNIQSEPENQFCTFSYGLLPFLVKEQNDFLKKFWRQKLNLEFIEEKANGFIKELLDQFSESTNDQDRKFFSIPLQVFMIANVFLDAFKKFYYSGNTEVSPECKLAFAEKLDIVALYEAFLETKLDIELIKMFSSFVDDQRKPSALSFKEKRVADFMTSHEKLAVYSIFKENQLKNMLSNEERKETSELMNHISEAKEKTGIISKIVDNKPQFIHRTFAEYFVANYIWEKFISIPAKKFEKDFVQNIFINILIKDDIIQVSKFLQLIARKRLNNEINSVELKDKMKILLKKLATRIKNYGTEKKKNNFQSIKLLLGVIKFSSLTQDERNDFNISEDQLLKLLCVCAEMGYTELTRTLMMNRDATSLTHHLSKNNWFSSPLWIAAENDHHDIIKFFVENFSYGAEWKDKDRKILIQSIFEKNAFNVLKCGLQLNIIDCRRFKNLKNVEKLPICEALSKQAPSEVIKLLIEKTDADVVNNFIHHECKLSDSDVIISELLDYDMEIIKLAIRKGIDFSFGMKIVLDKFDFKRIFDPVNSIKNFSGSHRGDFIKCCSLHSYKNLWNLFPTIKHLLKAGIGYNYVRAGLFQQTMPPTYRIVKQIYDMHELLNEVHKLHKEKNRENNDPRRMLLKLIFDYIRSLGFEGVKIALNPDKISILPRYKNKNKHKLMLNSITRVIQTKNSKSNEISILPLPKLKNNYNDPHDPFPKFKHVMTKLFFEYYMNGNGNSVKTAVDKLQELMISKKNDILAIGDFSSFSNYIREITRNNEMLENFPEKNYQHESSDNFEARKQRNESLNKLVKNLLCEILLLYFHQSYEITDAVKEISEEVLKLEKVINKLLEMKKNLGCKEDMILDHDQLLDLLDLKHIVYESDNLQNLMPEIFQYSLGINYLIDIWLTLNLVGQQKVMEVLEQMLKFSAQSLPIFELFKELHESYKSLIQAIKVDDIEGVTSVLQNTKQGFQKAVIHAQEAVYGSPLHYAAFNGQKKITRILLEQGANPNLRLSIDCRKITSFSEVEKKMKKYHFLLNDFINWTPLHFAVLNHHQDIVRNLIDRGAVVDPALKRDHNGCTPFRISTLSGGHLKIARLLLENGAHYNVPNKKRKTPLDLAKVGSDIGNLLSHIDKLFQAVENGEKNTVNSLFEKINFDSWSSVLNATNIGGMTLLNLATNNKKEDIAELLAEKLRTVESRTS